jgi:hypothetical protein
MQMTAASVACVNPDPELHPEPLHGRKILFLWGLMAISVGHYFALSIGTAYFQDPCKIRAWAVIPVASLFAPSQSVAVRAITPVAMSSIGSLVAFGALCFST